METNEITDGLESFAAEPATKMFLVTTVKPDLFASEGGKIPRPGDEPQTRARKVEDSAGLPRSVYLYAGLAHPSFGEMSFAFLPSFDFGRRGCGSPFDTGGLFFGHMDPLKELDPAEREQRASKVISKTRHLMSDWRAGFSGYLEIFFDGALGYLTGPPRPLAAPVEAKWYHPDLPACFAQPTTDRRAWTWEVRVHDAIDVIKEVEHLGAWTATQGAHAVLIETLTASSRPLPDTFDPGQLMARCVGVGPHFDILLMDWITKECAV